MFPLNLYINCSNYLICYMFGMGRGGMEVNQFQTEKFKPTKICHHDIVEQQFQTT